MGKKLILFAFCFALSGSLLAQVGINTIDPKAQLDIVSINPDNPLVTDGILIPRINNFPTTPPSADQNGMMVFLSVARTGFPAGFYYWDQAQAKWKAISGGASSNFYKMGTVTPSIDINDAVFREGNVSIGGEGTGMKLKVLIDDAESATVKTALEVENSGSSTSNTTYSITASNKSLTDSKKYGIKNTVSAEGKGIHYGIFNEVSQGTNEEIYGIWNDVGKTFGATKKHFGIYSEIGTTQGTGTVYGIYSAAFGYDLDKVYAGYFAGRLGIGNTPEVEYVLPAARGKENQFLVSDAVGILSWKYPNFGVYTSTTSSAGNYIIPEETFTLRINNDILSITIPEASKNKGRIINLVNWYGNSAKTLTFLGADDLFDFTTGNLVTQIAGGQKLIIQSAGNRWILLDK
ncbi:MAG TPA: hypothetical protein VFM59_06360 [Salinimicrobium sp.]|nr:hypothetical protein [Salinimicrobium sp.]